MPIGYGGRRNVIGLDFKSFCESRKYGLIYYNQRKDNCCLAYALVCAKVNIDAKHILLSNLQNNEHILKAKALEQCYSARVNLSLGGGIDEISKFQQFLSEYKIVVYNSRSGKSVIYEDKIIPWSVPRLNILKENDHYVAIKSLTAVFAVSYYCEQCHIGYSSRIAHRNCSYICRCCLKRPPCDIENDQKLCNLCGRTFRGDICFKEHITSVCSKLKK